MVASMAQHTLLTDRTLLGLTGADTHAVLQSTLTQDITLLNAATPLFAAHLSPQGKVLGDMLISTDGTMVYLDVAATIAMDIARSLHTYSIGQNVEFHDCSDTHQITAIWGEDAPTTAIPDPRLAALGWRIVQPLGTDLPGTAASLAAYHAHRIACGVPEVGVDVSPGQALTAELGYEHLHGVSFEKGCYVGQEVTARMHHKTQPKKRIHQVAYHGEAPAGTPITKGGREVGWLGSTGHGQALALLRLRDIATEEALMVGADTVTAISLPSYIPPLT